MECGHYSNSFLNLSCFERNSIRATTKTINILAHIKHASILKVPKLSLFTIFSSFEQEVFWARTKTFTIYNRTWDTWKILRSLCPKNGCLNMARRAFGVLYPTNFNFTFYFHEASQDSSNLVWENYYSRLEALSLSHRLILLLSMTERSELLSRWNTICLLIAFLFSGNLLDWARRPPKLFFSFRFFLDIDYSGAARITIVPKRLRTLISSDWHTMNIPRFCSLITWLVFTSYPLQDQWLHCLMTPLFKVDKTVNTTWERLQQTMYTCNDSHSKARKILIFMYKK